MDNKKDYHLRIDIPWRMFRLPKPSISSSEITVNQLQIDMNHMRDNQDNI